MWMARRRNSGGGRNHVVDDWLGGTGLGHPFRVQDAYEREEDREFGSFFDLSCRPVVCLHELFAVVRTGLQYDVSAIE